MTTIILTTKINGAVTECFDAARNIDLHQKSMRQFNEIAINGVTSGLINNGESVTWKAKHFGINMKMTVGITEMSRPHSFTDEMIKGPFKSMKHQHLFSSDGGITIMKDIFEFQSPFGLAGKLFDRLFLKMYMKNLLVARNKVIKSNVEGSL
jgi:ligand-binding SRPBCC domain-containing protein